MRDRPINLGIETSARRGSLALGRGDELLACVDLPEQRRHRVGLMPGIAALFAEHGVTPRQLSEVYVSLGPGSFTGLRVSVSCALALGLAQAVRFVGVPTLEVVASQAPEEAARVAVCLNVKRAAAWSAVYERAEGGLRVVAEPGLRTLAALLAMSSRPVTLMGEVLPASPSPMDEGVTVVSGEAARPRAEAVWRLGRERAKRGAFTPVAALRPIYARQPEAVTLWDQRKAKVGGGG